MSSMSDQPLYISIEGETTKLSPELSYFVRNSASLLHSPIGEALIVIIEATRRRVQFDAQQIAKEITDDIVRELVSQVSSATERELGKLRGLPELARAAGESP